MVKRVVWGLVVALLGYYGATLFIGAPEDTAVIAASVLFAAAVVAVGFVSGGVNRSDGMV